MRPLSRVLLVVSAAGACVSAIAFAFPARIVALSAERAILSYAVVSGVVAWLASWQRVRPLVATPRHGLAVALRALLLVGAAGLAVCLALGARAPTDEAAIRACSSLFFVFWVFVVGILTLGISRLTTPRIAAFLRSPLSPLLPRP